MIIRGAAVEDLTDEEFLGRVELLERGRREQELGLLLAASEWAARNDAHSIDQQAAGLPGRESVRLYGGPGTPYVASFAGVEFGARMGRSAAAGDRYIATALDLDYRLPQLRHRVRAMEVEVSYAMYVARRTRELSREEAGYVDSRVAEFADGRIPWSRFEALVQAAITAANPQAAREREEKARRAQFARRVRANSDGVGVFMIRAAWPVIARIDATVGLLAQILKNMGVDGSADELRVKAALLMADPPAATALLAQYATWKQRPTDPAPDADSATDPEPEDDDDGHQRTVIVKTALELWRANGGETTGEQPAIDWAALLPAITLFVHTYGGRRVVAGLVNDEPTEIARVEGYGAVTDAWVRDYLGPQARFTIRQVIDIENQAPVDSYEIPDRHRQAVRLMTPADVFPFSSATVNQPDGWPAMQVDHTTPWRPVAPDDEPDEKPSRIGNYGPMTQFHHNLKTHGGWQVKQPFPGIYLWRDPHGALYLVDHTGTRRVRTWTTNIQLDLVDYDPAA